MITGVDHLVLVVADLDAAIADYETLFGAPPQSRDVENGVGRGLFSLGNIGLELLAPVGMGDGADRVRKALESGEGLKSIAFSVDGLDAFHRRVSRVGLAPEDIVARETPSASWRSFRATGPRTNGLRLFFIERAAPLARQESGALGVDHVVVSTQDADRTAALFGARLGLTMALDHPSLGRRLLFFRCGDMVVEVAAPLDETRTDAPDALWGVTWRVPNADAAQARLAAAGVDVSPVREGRKPGTRVVSVRSGTRGVPTLLLEPAASLAAPRP